MSFSTALLGPWDNVSTADKQLISVAIPPDVKERVFTVLLPRRGSVDKLLARLLFLVDAYVAQNPDILELDPSQREETVNNLLNSFVDHLQALKLEDILP